MEVALITKEGLKDALAKFRVRGDERWARFTDIPTQASISEMVAESLRDAGVLRDDDVGGFTDEDMADIIAML